jgi:hypothetical protein
MAINPDIPLSRASPIPAYAMGSSEAVQED